MLLMILEIFTKKELQETNQREFRIEKVIKRKMINFILNGKDKIICLIAG